MVATTKRRAQRVTARKYMGDDAGSWAVFLDGQPRMTGLTRSEVPYYRAEVARMAGIKRGTE